MVLELKEPKSGLRQWIFRQIDSYADKDFDWVEDEEYGLDILYVERVFISNFLDSAPFLLILLIGLPVSFAVDAVLVPDIINVSGRWYFPDQSYGLVLDAIGAILLAKGVLRGPLEIVQESQTGLKYNSDPALAELIDQHGSRADVEERYGIQLPDNLSPEQQIHQVSGRPVPWVTQGQVSQKGHVYASTQRLSMAKSTVEGVWGIIFLVSGFILQIIALFAPVFAKIIG